MSSVPTLRTVCRVVAILSVSTAALVMVPDGGLPWAPAASPEIRATWITTSGNDDWTTANIGTTMSSLKQVGLNTVYVQAWKNGYTNFTSGSLAAFTGVSSTNSSITSPTLIADARSAAAASGLVMGAWFEYGLMAQYTGNTGTTTTSFNALAQKCRDATWTLTSGTSTVSGTGWLLRDSSGNYTTASNGFVWMNPLVPEVKNLIKGVVIDAVKQFDLQIVQFDDHLAWPQAFGWDSYTLTAYKQETGRGTPATTTDANFLAWRQGKTQAFFSELSDAVKTVKPSVLVSLAPSVIATSSSSYCADWTTWMGKTDEVLPQVYRSTISAFNTDWPLQITAAGTNTAELGAGLRLLGTGSATPWSDLQQQIDRTRTDGALGHSIWYSDGISNSGTLATSNYNSQLTAYYNVATNGIAANPFFQSVRWSGTGGNGGSGTWSQLDSQWKDRSTIWVSSGTGIFDGVGGTVTVSGSVMSEVGLDFRTTGYTVTGGTLTFQGVSRSNNRVSVATSATTTFATLVTGTTGLTKSGTGTLVITGTATGLTGGIQIDAGTLQVGSSGTVGSLNASTPITVATGGTLAFNRSDTYGGNVANVISGSGGVALLSGTLVLSGSNTYTGTTTVTQGTLQVGNGGTAGAIAGDVICNGRLVFNRSDTVVYSGAITGTGSVATQGTGWLTFSGPTSFTGGLTVGGTGVLTLAAFTGYSGITSVASSGTLQVGNGGTAGGLGIGSVVNDGVIIFNRSDNYGGAFGNSFSGAGSLVLSRGSLGLSGSNSYGGGTVVRGGTLSLAAGGAINHGAANVVVGNLTGDSGGLSLPAGTLTGSSGILGSGSGSTGVASVSGSGNWTNNGSLTVGLSGTGTLSITQTGLVRVGGTAGTGTLTLASGSGSRGTLNIGTGGTSGTLQASVVTGGSGSAAVVFNHTSGSYAFVPRLTGTMSVTQAGPGLTLLSASNSYVGTTTVSSGTLQFASRAALYGGGTSSWTAANVTTGSGATLALSVGGTANEFTAADIDLLKGIGTGSTGFLSGATLGLDTTNAATGTFSYSNAIANPNGGANQLGLTKLGPGTLVLSGSNTYSGATTVTQGTLRFASVASINATSGIGVAAGGVLAYSGSTAGTLTKAVSGSGGFMQAGAGTLSLSAANTYTGTTTIAAGSLRIGAGGTTGGIHASSPIAVAAGGTLGFNRSDNYGGTFTNTISGSGGVQVLSGLVTLTGSNTYTGPTTVQGGTLAIGAGGTQGSIPGNITNNAAVVFNRSNAFTYAGAISGTGSVAKQGAGVFTLNGSNTYTGPTTVAAGTLQLGVAGAVASSAVTVAGGATLAVGPQVQATVPSLANNGLVDVGLGRITVASGQTAAGLVNQITAGIVNGGTTGITSSNAAANSGAFTVGWLDNFDGSYTFSYAAYGDTNLDDVVDLSDLLNTVGSGKYDAGTAANWLEGDFTYDGVSDLSDLLLLVGGGLYDGANYNPPGQSPLLLGLNPGGADAATTLATVPEPASGTLAASAVLLMPLLAGLRVRYHARRRQRTP